MSNSLIDCNIVLPNILIIGSSGTGKSSALRNLDPETTAILNIERKQLPFRSAGKFKYNKMLNSVADITNELMMGVGIDPAIEVVVIESFPSLDEDILATCRKQYQGWDIFFNHNKMVRDFFSLTKMLCQPRTLSKGKLPPKFVVVIGLDEIVNLTLPSGAQKSTRRLKVDGKELTGTIEKEFTIVLFTELVESSIAGKQLLEYKFLTNTDGICSAKTPMEMFKDKYIDNDLNKVIQEIKKYYDIK